MFYKSFPLLILFFFSTILNGQINKREYIFGTAGPNTNIQFVDIDGDGVDDINVAGKNDLYVFLNNGDFSFKSKGELKIPLISDRLDASSYAFIDVENDGDKDLIHIGCPACALSEVRVLLNVGDNKFVDKGFEYDVFGGFLPSGIVVSDFDSDGDEDFVIVDTKFSTLRFTFMENQEGKFSGSLVTSIDDFGFHTLQYQDINDDGIPEIFLNNGGDLHFFKYENGGFEEFQILENNGSNFYSYNDINGDGRVDLYYKNSAGLYVIYADGEYNFKPAEVYFSGSSCQSAYHLYDIDLDGDLDVLYGKCNDSGVYMYENNDGSYTGDIQITDVVDQVIRIHQKDINGDSKMDLCVLGNDEEMVIIEDPSKLSRNFSHFVGGRVGNNGVRSIDVPTTENDVLVTFDREWIVIMDDEKSYRTVYNGKNIKDVGFTDLDNDSDGDMIITFDADPSPNVDTTLIWVENENGVFGNENLIFSDYLDAVRTLAYDFDNDGDIDYTIFSDFNSTKHIINEGGTFSDDQIGGTGKSASLADINNDGWMDLISLSPTGRAYYYENDANGSFKTRVTIANSSSGSILARDFDGDGDLDIALSDIFSNVEIFEFDNESFTLRQTLEGYLGALESADIDEDGNLDLISSIDLSIISNLGNFTFENQGESVDENYAFLNLVKFDNNDNYDLVCHLSGVLAGLYLHKDVQGMVDNDNDGYYASEDCDDNNPDVNPGATEISDNNIDEDCDGVDNLVLNTNQIENEISFYPNPTSGYLYVENLETFTEFEIHDINGKLSKKGHANKTIDLSSLSNNLYLISFISDQKVVTRKVLISK